MSNDIEVGFKAFDKGISFPFELISETVTDIDKCNFFFVSKKRVYLSILERIASDLNYVLEKLIDPELFLNKLLSIRQGIEDDVFGTINDVVEVLKEEIIDDTEIQQIVFNKINQEYNISIEDKNKSEELQFKDSYAKLIISVGMFSRLVIPILTSYIERQSILIHHKRGDIAIYDNAFLDTLNNIFKVYNKDDEGKTVDLAFKIYRFIASSVDNTLYSDKVIWNYLENKSIHETNLALKLFRQIIKDIVPKLESNKSIVSLLHVVAKKQIEYQFTQKFKVTYKPITAVKTDSEGNNINPFTRLETKLVRSNEAEYIFNKENIISFIQKNKIFIPNSEYDYYFKNIQVNTIQTKLLNFYANKFIGKGTNIYYCNRQEYIYILLNTKKWLEKSNFEFINLILTAKVKEVAKKGLGRNKLLHDILDSKVYGIILKKYGVMSEKISENNVIVNFIAEILNTEFEYLPNSTEEPSTLFDFNEIPQKYIISEILDFLEKI